MQLCLQKADASRSQVYRLTWLDKEKHGHNNMQSRGY